MFQIPVELTFTKNKEVFVMHDSGREDVCRLLIFSTNQLLNVFNESRELFGDGTFKLAPKHFKQIYILRAPHDGVLVTGNYNYKYLYDNSFTLGRIT